MRETSRTTYASNFRAAKRIARSIGRKTKLPWSVKRTIAVLAANTRRTANGVKGLADGITAAHLDKYLPNPMANPIARRALRGACRLAPAPARS